MGKKEPLSSRNDSVELRVHAVQLAGSIGGNADAEHLGNQESTTTDWRRRGQARTLN